MRATRAGRSPGRAYPSFLNAPRAFGHVGFTTVVAWADPERELSVCLMNTGKPLATPGQLAWAALVYTIAGRIGRARTAP